MVMFILCFCSMVLIYSAASNQLLSPTERHNLLPYIRSHGFYLVLGLLVAGVVQHFDYRRLAPFSRICYILAVVLLLLTIIFGKNSNGVQRSIEIFGRQVQTFYFIVLLVVVYASHAIALMGKRINDIRKEYIPFLIWVMLLTVVVMTQNFSTGFILLSTVMFMLFISELKLRVWLITGLFFVLLFVFLVATSGLGIKRLHRFQTVHARVERFFDRSAKQDVATVVANMSCKEVDGIYQEVLTEGAVATGGIFPVNGPGNSIYNNTPQIYSDCIFALAVEEYGVLLSVLFLIVPYLLLFFQVFLMVGHVPTPFGAYLAGGLGFWIVFQAMVHISVCTGVFPNTGQTLPMVSWGNVSILVTSVCFGLLLNISKSKKKNRENVQTKGEENG
ncbi:MAG: FtsW/RodA/SpoVE family cell cycle protein [Bacteroidales bacterium]|nr:FtsW/RodA/SpoVE family cell cycle protein [Bacteroidales bacterium]